MRGAGDAVARVFVCDARDRVVRITRPEGNLT
jgi:YD repeat-containing protein